MRRVAFLTLSSGLHTDWVVCPFALDFPFVGGVANRRAPSLHGHYAASQLLRAPPPPSRLPPFSWVRQLCGFLASAIFMTGRGGLLQLLDMSLSPSRPYSPAGAAFPLGHPAPGHPSFAPIYGPRPPALHFVS